MMPAVTFDWANKRVIVTGGAGFLGQVVVRILIKRGAVPGNIFVPRRSEFDLTTEEACARLYREAFAGRLPDVLFHLAAEVGGIGANRLQPGRFFYANMAMALHLIEQARCAGMPESGGLFVQVGTICSYPLHTPIPFREADLWNGYPEPTNAPYGVAKRAAWQMLDAYHRQYGQRSACVLPANLYGPGDHFDLETSHVIPALIRKCVEAHKRRLPSVECWGTGAATREFLYVDDAAEGIVRAAEALEEPVPINLGANSEVSIRDLALMICGLIGFTGRVEWDPSRPDGQPRRCVDATLAAERLGWRATVPLEEGLRRTIDWYLRHRR